MSDKYKISGGELPFYSMPPLTYGGQLVFWVPPLNFLVDRDADS
jgi:hypothetical protein